MKTKQYITLAVVVSVGLFATARGAEQLVATSRGDDGYGPLSLTGLSGVYVEVSGPPLEIKPDGLLTAALRRDVEQQLRKTGIRVLSREELPGTPGTPHLALKVTIHEDQENFVYAFGIEMALVQDVVLSRNTKLVSRGATWTAGAVGLVGAQSLQDIRPSVWKSVGRFITDYRTANPKR